MIKNKAFTLVELLVVISIIALLMSVLMPSLQKARLAAEEVICRSNLRQYSLAGAMYLSDNAETFPNAWESIYKSAGSHPQCQWHNAAMHPDRMPELQGALWKYIGGGGKVHYCRTFARLAKTFGKEHKDHTNMIPIEPLFCYSMNAFLGLRKGSFPEAVNDVIIKSVQVQRPTEVFFFAEENCWPAETDPSLPPWISKKRYEDTLNDNALCGAPLLPNEAAAWQFPRDQGPPYKDAFGSFHKTTTGRKNEGVADAIFLDGHVKSVEPDRTYYYTRPMDSVPSGTTR